jgi:hypothetical protein
MEKFRIQKIPKSKTSKGALWAEIRNRKISHSNKSEIENPKSEIKTPLPKKENVILLDLK